MSVGILRQRIFKTAFRQYCYQPGGVDNLSLNPVRWKSTDNSASLLGLDDADAPQIDPKIRGSAASRCDGEAPQAQLSNSSRLSTLVWETLKAKASSAVSGLGELRNRQRALTESHVLVRVIEARLQAKHYIRHSAKLKTRFCDIIAVGEPKQLYVDEQVVDLVLPIYGIGGETATAFAILYDGIEQRTLSIQVVFEDETNLEIVKVFKLHAK